MKNLDPVPSMSVVVATYNRAEILKTTLLKLEEQDCPKESFDVVVVDDGSSDETSQMIDALRCTLSFRLSYLRHENRGPGYTQNRGIQAARSELILLLADDIWADELLVRRHLEKHCEHPEVNLAILGGVSPSQDLPSTWLHRKWDPFQYSRFRDGQELDGIYFHACNISFKKAFVTNTGLFKELRGAAHEDIELGYRLGQNGLRILYCHDAHGRHYHPESLNGICRRAFERGVNFNLLTDNIPREYILPKYKILSWDNGLLTCIKMAPREICRLALFNHFTIHWFWVPFLRSVDSRRKTLFLAGAYAYRGVAGYFLRKGYLEMQYRSGVPK